MALYQVDIQKQMGSEYWTNRYIVEASDVTAASVLADDILEAERDIHSTNVGFSAMRVATFPVSDGSFIITPLSGTGNRTFSGGQLALFNVARVVINVGLGRPSVKYYRAPIYEGDQEDGSLTIAFRAIVDTALNDLIAAGPGLVDVDGQPWVQATTQTPVGMRQLRRGSRRRTEPVI